MIHVLRHSQRHCSATNHFKWISYLEMTLVILWQVDTTEISVNEESEYSIIHTHTTNNNNKKKKEEKKNV